MPLASNFFSTTSASVFLASSAVKEVIDSYFSAIWDA